MIKYYNRNFSRNLVQKKEYNKEKVFYEKGPVAQGWSDLVLLFDF